MRSPRSGRGSCILVRWRMLGRLRLSKRPLGCFVFLFTSPMMDRRTALGTRSRVSQMTANENTYRRSELIIQASAAARTTLCDELKLWIPSSSTANIRARIPGPGGVAGVCSVGRISRPASGTCAISFTELLPWRGLRPGVGDALRRGRGSYVSESGLLSPRARE